MEYFKSLYGREGKSPDLNTRIFITGFLIWSVFIVLYWSTVVPDTAHTFRIIRLLGMAIMLASFLFKKNVQVRPWQFVVLMASLIFLAINSFLFAHDSITIDLSIVLASSIGVNFASILDYYIPLRFFELASVVIAARLGFINDEVSGDGRNRHNLGFYWSSFAPYMLFFLVLLCVQRYKGKLSGWVVLGSLIVNQYLFYMTDTKTPYLLTLLAIFVWFTLKYSSHIRHLVMLLGKPLGIVLFPVLTVINVFLSLTQAKGSVLDKMVAGRFALGNTALSDYGVGIFGQRIFAHVHPEGPLESYFTIDSGLLRLLIQFGMIAFILYCGALAILMIRLANEGDVFTISVVFLVILSGFSDPWNLYVDFDVFLLLIPAAIVFHQNDFARQLNKPTIFRSEQSEREV
ncbi:hypothetical protein [Lacticaseibacillus pantheris]